MVPYRQMKCAKIIVGSLMLYLSLVRYITSFLSFILVYYVNVSVNHVNHQHNKHILRWISILFAKRLLVNKSVFYMFHRVAIFAYIFTKGLPLVLLEDFCENLSAWKPPTLPEGVC